MVRLFFVSVFFCMFSQIVCAESGTSIFKPGDRAEIDVNPVSIVAIVSRNGRVFVISGASNDKGNSLASAFGDLTANARHLGLQMGTDIQTSDIFFDSSDARDERLISPVIKAIMAETKNRAALLDFDKSSGTLMAKCQSNCAIESIKNQYRWLDLYNAWQASLNTVVDQLASFQGNLNKSFKGKLDLSQFHMLKRLLNSLPLKAEAQNFEIFMGVVIQDGIKSQDLSKSVESLNQIVEFYQSSFGEEPPITGEYLPRAKIVLNPIGVSVPSRSELN